MNNRTITKIMIDLLVNEPQKIDLPQLPKTTQSYLATTTQIEEHFEQLYRKFLRYSRLRKHKYVLFFAYHLGLMIEEATPARKIILRSKLSAHYRTGIYRIYLLFEPYGIAQIFRTSYVNFTILRTMSARDFRSLCNWVRRSSILSGGKLLYRKCGPVNVAQYRSCRSCRWTIKNVENVVYIGYVVFITFV